MGYWHAFCVYAKRSVNKHTQGGTPMPRLQGERSNAGMWIVLLLVVLVIAFVLLEYFGVINLIPNFGAA